MDGRTGGILLESIFRTMPNEFTTQRRIEFADTDQAGIVHFARFFVFMETAEHQFLNSLGASVHTKVDGDEIGWPRLAASCEYLSPLRFEDVVDIRVYVTRKGVKSMTYSFEFSRDGTPIARGKMSSACCICNPGEQIRAVAIPQALAQKIEQA